MTFSLGEQNEPLHPGVILDLLLEACSDMNLEDVANYLGISRQLLYLIRAKRNSVTPVVAKRLSIVFGTSAAFWIRLQAEYDVWQVEQVPPPKDARPIVGFQSPLLALMQ